MNQRALVSLIVVCSFGCSDTQRPEWDLDGICDRPGACPDAPLADAGGGEDAGADVGEDADVDAALGADIVDEPIDWEDPATHFVTTWTTNTKGAENPLQVTIPTGEGNFDYDMN